MSMKNYFPFCNVSNNFFVGWRVTIHVPEWFHLFIHRKSFNSDAPTTVNPDCSYCKVDKFIHFVVCISFRTKHRTNDRFSMRNFDKNITFLDERN